MTVFLVLFAISVGSIALMYWLRPRLAGGWQGGGTFRRAMMGLGALVVGGGALLVIVANSIREQESWEGRVGLMLAGIGIPLAAGALGAARVLSTFQEVSGYRDWARRSRKENSEAPKQASWDQPSLRGYRVGEMPPPSGARREYRGLDRWPEMKDEQFVCAMDGRADLVDDRWLSATEDDAYALLDAISACCPDVDLEVIFVAQVPALVRAPDNGYFLAGFDVADESANLSLLSARALEYLDADPRIGGLNEHGLMPEMENAEKLLRSELARESAFVERELAIWEVWLPRE